MQHIVFGGQGFIGQNLCRQLVATGSRVVCIDKNLWGNQFVFRELQNNHLFNFMHLNINDDREEIISQLKDFGINEGKDLVWHLAANSDIPGGIEDITRDLDDTFYTTVSVLDIMKNLALDKLVFASSSAVYGSVPIPTSGFSEDSNTQPISNYGAMKLASEAVIRASHVQWLKFGLICRFPNVIGYPATHGVILDFMNKLKIDQSTLHVLGNGLQNKPYLHVTDLISAMQHVAAKLEYVGLDVINIASTFPNVYVHEIAKMVTSRISPSAEILYGTTDGGWKGDMPQVEFNVDKLNKTGWSADLTGHEAVLRTIEENIKGNELYDYNSDAS